MNIRKLISLIELFLSLSLMFVAGMNPANSSKIILVSILFGIGALISVGLLD